MIIAGSRADRIVCSRKSRRDEHALAGEHALLSRASGDFFFRIEWIALLHVLPHFSIDRATSMITFTFYGAARTVTGSCHLMQVKGKNILLDCGMFQGRREESWQKNLSFPFDPATIDVLVLSHAHIDHSGKIPMLVKRGFTGTIISTHATRDLANIMLLDSAHIQEKDALYVNKKNEKLGLPPVEPIYSMEDVLSAMEQFQTVGYRRKVRLTEAVTLTFFDAGHILGSAIPVFDISENGSSQRVCFTGDLGRPNRPILRDPDTVGDIDVLISECTYGGRFHLDEMSALDTLEAVIKRTVARGGKIIVPAFSVGRTQELVYDLHQLQEAGRLPRIPMFVDSPLSVNATQIFRIHPECMDSDVRAAILTRQDPFGFEKLTYISSSEESKELNSRRDPVLIISSSGMCEAGRILHHLANNIEDKRNTVLITGYNAEHTLGRRLVEKQPEVRIFGDMYSVKAEVVVMNSLSAHADRTELLAFHSQFSRERLQNIFLVHGDLDQQQKLETGLKEELGFARVSIPSEGDKVTV
jgi:metallo-beta-lactamase family protein